MSEALNNTTPEDSEGCTPEWARLDSNQRRQSHQIYSREPEAAQAIMEGTVASGRDSSESAGPSAKIRFGSFCSGIGAPDLAWSRLGWEPQFFSEIEPFPCSVLSRFEYRDDGTANAILTPNGGRSGVGVGVGAIAMPTAVRRLTVVECSRLHGFPDNYLLSLPLRPRKIDAEDAVYLMSRRIDCRQEDGQWKTRVAADAPMYRAMGNSMAVPVVRWIGARIEAVDGIGSAGGSDSESPAEWRAAL